MANIVIDGKPYTVKDGITIIEAIDQAKIPLPRYCYHPGLSIAGNCRICQVEVEKMPRTVIACNTRVAEGMVITTQSQKAKESQQAVLEFILANHPLDCPVCDQAGECKLQDYYMQYGLYDPKFNEQKVKKSKKAFSVGPTIMLDQERCILCSRCVRFTDEITKTHEFGLFGRGDHTQVDVTPGRQLDNKYSGNVADICPVGALTDKDFRFKLRVWYLGKQESVCPGCSRGCNISLEFEKSRPYHLKNDRVMRLKPRENADVNKWWMCDEGRYAYKSIDHGRQLDLKPGPTWANAVEKTGSYIKEGKAKWALLASPQYTNEELYLMKKLFKDKLGWSNIAFYPAKLEGYEDNFLIKKDKNPNTAGASHIFGMTPQQAELGTVIDKAKKGELEGLFIFGHDLEKIFGAETLKEVRQKVKTIIYEGAHDNSTARAADVVLPAAVYAEKEGTFTNFEGRVQRIKKALEPLGASRPTWTTLAELGQALGLPNGYKKADDVLVELAKENEAFRDMNFKKIGPKGLVWNKK
jgi:NADH-quinone oxidoreductase subunit G